MYKSRKNHLIVLMLDLISLTSAYYLSGLLRFFWINPLNIPALYRNSFLVTLLLYMIVYGCFENCETFLQREYINEFFEVLRLVMIFFSCSIIILFLLQLGTLYSRGFFLCFLPLQIIFTLVNRVYYKVWLQAYYRKSIYSEKVLIVTTAKKAEIVVRKFYQECIGQSYITGIAILDENLENQKIANIPVIASKENLFTVSTNEVVDRVLLDVPLDGSIEIEPIILGFENMGVPVELCVSELGFNIREKMVRSYQGFHVMTFSSRLFDESTLLIKRLFDILGAIVGIAITAVISIFVVPAIFIESPGPVIFKQIRIGKNGRRFQFYKFRSMYLDAEARKKELMEKNQMNGLMFKIENDPRITKVGKFIRKTSIDELPQFFNVLKGDMSLVGTRPPTEDEFLQYDARHKVRLAFQPGITGLWQVSGRSDITDFEEVVKLDVEYMDRWSLKEDFIILCKTIWIVIAGRGAK